MTPGSCSIGIHLLLEEVEAPFQVHVVDLLSGTYAADFLMASPRGTVPALVLDDGRALNNFQDIALYLAEAYPRKQLLPAGESQQAQRALSALDYAVSTVHGEAFARVFMAGRYSAAPDGQSQTVAQGRALAEQGLLQLQSMMQGDPYVIESFSIADAAAFYVEFWAERVGIPLPVRCQQHYEALLQRPAVRQVMAEEGYISTLQKYPAQSVWPFSRS